MAVAIRPARPDDAPVLTALSLRSKQSNGYDGAFMAACRDELTIHPDDIAEDEYWVAEADIVCGCACLSADADGRSGQVHAFFIDPDWQRRGVGRRLWAQLHDRARARGLAELRLDADPNAVPFYEALGFRVVGDAPSGSIPGRTIPHMTLALKPA